MIWRVRRASKSLDLRPARYPGPHPVPMGVLVDDVLAQSVAGAHADRVRPRTDDRHVAAQHVEELGQLVEATLAQEGAEPRDPVVVAAGLARALRIPMPPAHGAKLEHLEGGVVATLA